MKKVLLILLTYGLTQTSCVHKTIQTKIKEINEFSNSIVPHTQLDIIYLAFVVIFNKKISISSSSRQTNFKYPYFAKP